MNRYLVTHMIGAQGLSYSIDPSMISADNYIRNRNVPKLFPETTGKRQITKNRWVLVTRCCVYKIQQTQHIEDYIELE